MITPYSLLLFAVSFTVAFAGGSAWRKRHVPGGLALSLTLFSIAVWCFFSAMETTSTDTAQRYFWSSLSLIGLCNSAPLLLVFAIQYADSPWPLTPGMLALYWLVPVATILLAFTNNLHHWYWTGIRPGPVAGTNTVIYGHGPGFFITTFFLLIICLLASYHLAKVAIRASRLYMAQGIILVASILFPWIGAVLYLLPSDPVPGLDTTSLGFAVSAILIMTAFNRLRFLDLVPRARAAIVENMPEGFIVVDLLERIVDINATALRLLGIEGAAFGKAVGSMIPALGGVVPQTVTLNPLHDAHRTLEVSVTPLTTRAGRPSGRMYLVRDITERQKLITDLQEALANVKRLSGLLPICASCKKIRDDKGYWHQVESYMGDHAEVEFSHGLCPDCLARLYPEMSK